MTLKPQLAWYLFIEGEKQFLYYAEQPRGDFKEGEKTPEWFPIQVEMPTRLMKATESWVESGEPLDVLLEHRDQIREKAVASWSLIGAMVDQHYIRKSKQMDDYIRFAVVHYKEARHAHV